MERTIFHVVPEAGSWAVAETDGQVSNTYATKAEAIEAARERAGAARPAQVVVHGEDGQVQKESTYEADPFPPSG